MKPNSLVPLTMLLSFCFCSAQEIVTLKSGKKIIILPNGIWKDETSNNSSPNTGLTITRPFTATTKASIARGKCSIFFDSKIWKLKNTEEGGRTFFEHANGDAYALIITERTEYPIDTLKLAAITNAKNAAPDMEVVHEEKRNINNKEILYMQMKGSVKGINLHYYGYYYSGKEGAVQVLTWTSQNLIDGYKLDFLNFLNGLSIEP